MPPTRTALGKVRSNPRAGSRASVLCHKRDDGPAARGREAALPETVILAIGGNALAPAGLGDFADQEERARSVARTAVRIVAEGNRLLIVHGNGPQVGALAMAQEAVAREIPPQPLFVLGAMTQGQLGYLIAQAVGDALVAADRAPGGRRGRDPGGGGPRGPGLRQPDQADRALLLGGARAAASPTPAAGP